MPILKNNLITKFCRRTAITEEAFAARRQVSRQTLRNASNGLSVQPRVAEAIASGMGLLVPQELCLINHDDHTMTADQLIDLSKKRLGIGLWGVCDHDFIQTDRFRSLLQHWRGEHVQLLRGENGEERELISTLDGKLCAAGRTICGDMTLCANEPGFFVATVKMRVEGYWFGDNHYIAIYRFLDTEMPNFGTAHATLSPCNSRLEGFCSGWNNPSSAWVTAQFRLRRVVPCDGKNA